jgi:hypothetical protein
MSAWNRFEKFSMCSSTEAGYSDASRHAADRLQGGELGDDLEKMGDLVARFSKTAEPIMKDFFSGIVAGKNPMRIMDVGCVLLEGADTPSGSG